MPHIIVERTFESPLTNEELRVVEKRMGRCLDLYRVRWIRSFWSADKRRMLCEYEAPDAASVRKVQHEAEAKFDRIWVAEVLGQP
ncbi:MAG TPA: DUF4242 domain-containing protein [Candidatus Sulfotelmatobacter sp.]|nr:DUF4242 domain-containing protein [Candidatus Sulfotelmatobacter sp.]